MFRIRIILKRMMGLSLLASLGFAALLCGVSPASGVGTPPPLTAASTFAVLSATPDVTNTGLTVVTGDVGVSPALAVIGFPPGIVIGTIYTGPGPAAAAQVANTNAYGFLGGEACDVTFGVPTDLAGMTLVPGVYCFASSAGNTGLLQLDAQGNPNAVWVFLIPSTLITGSGSSVVAINGGQDCNVWWAVGSSATLFTNTTFIGNILALTSITLQTGATLSGRAFAQTGEVTLSGSVVTMCSLALPPPTNTPTLGKAFNLASINEGVGNVSTLTITLSNPNASVATLTAPLIDTLPLGVTIAAIPNASTTCTGTGAVVAVPFGPTVTLPATRSIPAGTLVIPGTCTVTVDVTAPVANTYINTIPAGALQTSNGNNAAPAIATLTVSPLVPPNGPPTLGKTFNPVLILAGGVSTLTIRLSNPNVAVATLTAPFTDVLPSGVVIENPTNASTTCGGGAGVIATAGGTMVTLPAGRSIPASAGGIAGTCTITVNVTAAHPGSFVNTLAIGALQTSNGNNAAPAIATLTVSPATAVPTLNEWGAIFFMVLAGLGSLYYLRKHRKV